ncbi:MAG: D-alanyl-D-alanine carboxypeptidase [Bacilli bacterium]|nr:D-alanyl-D-alanine carboxypeptidase [Bacilli bacterium]MDD4809303.1 D-alanyl-D-alanine carboxypeptidase [Bacilli bacterium]
MKKIIIILILLLIPFEVSGLENATAVIVMDQDSHRILYSKNIHQVRSVASISKIMTALLAVESGKLQDEVLIGEEINGSYGSGIYIKEDELITLESLVYGLMLRSGNDAALAIAHYVGGDVDKFVELMNEKAKQIGMKNTTFNNPSGLDEDKGNYSTAYDMAILTSYAMKNDLYRKIIETKKYKVKTNLNYYSWTNKNKLLYLYRYATGGKTGYTEIAKRTLVTTASKNNLNLVIVTLNDGDDFNNHMNLYEEYFNEYQGYTILHKGLIPIDLETYYPKNSLYLKKEYRYPLNESEKDNVVIEFKLIKKKQYRDGNKVGKVHVKLGDKVLYRDDIYIQIKKKKIDVFNLIVKWLTNDK